MDAKSSEKLPCKFICEVCDYSTSKKSSYDKHLLTHKHINRIKMNNLEQEKGQKDNFICNNCNKVYKARNSLWYHERKCKPTEEQVQQINQNESSISKASISDPSHNTIQLLINENKELINENKEFKNENKEIKNMILELVKSNNELQKQMIEVCQKIQPGNTTINSNNNSNNKTFNLQLFLNEECKDAMNMSEFINSIELKISDLVNIGKLGYVEGVSNIIIKQLNDTDMNKRPVHCSDAKRETLYVKEENKWEKETQETKQMLTAVRGVNKKNYQMLHKWKETHPKCTDSKSTQCDDYMKIMSKVMDGDVENINKVIKKVAKQVLIDK